MVGSTRRTRYPGLQSGSLSQQFDWRRGWFPGRWGTLHSANLEGHLQLRSKGLSEVLVGD